MFIKWYILTNLQVLVQKKLIMLIIERNLLIFYFITIFVLTAKTLIKTINRRIKSLCCTISFV